MRWAGFLWHGLTRRFSFWRVRRSQAGPRAYPANLQDLRGGDPCWCGSGKVYRRCHRPQDRRRERDLGLNRRRRSICEAFT